MKAKRILPVILASYLIFFITGIGWADPKTPGSAVAYFPQKNYIFKPVVDGTAIMYDYIVQNKGSATLLIEKVKTD